MKKSFFSILMSLGVAMSGAATAAPGKEVPLGCGVHPLTRIAISEGYLKTPGWPLGRPTEAYPGLIEFEALFRAISTTAGVGGIRNVASFDAKVASIIRELGSYINHWKSVTDDVRQGYIDALSSGRDVERLRLMLNEWTRVLEGYRDAHDRIVAEAVRVRPCFPN